MINRDNFLASLSNVKDVNAHYAFLRGLASRGEIASLRRLAEEVCECTDRTIPGWAIDGVMDQVVRVLALTPGINSAMAAIQLALVALARTTRSSARTPAVASKIVFAQSGKTIAQMLSAVSDTETLACLLHESVVRNKLEDGSEVVQRSAGRLAAEHHPLACLPVRLFEFEAGAPLPHYGPGCASTALPFGPSVESNYMECTSGGALSFTETTCPERAAWIGAAVKNWEDDSNGKTEARCFSVATPVERFAPLLAGFGLHCLTEGDKACIQELAQLDAVFRLLFSAASSGGAYNHGEFAAYGRLRAWQSLAGLVGWAGDLDVSSVATIAETCQWCTFLSANDWSYQVAWDLGIGCYNPSRGEVAILAATDTD